MKMRCRHLFKFQETGGRNGDTNIAVYFAPSPQGGFAECGTLKMPKKSWDALSVMLINANSRVAWDNEIMITRMALGENND